MTDDFDMYARTAARIVATLASLRASRTAGSEVTTEDFDQAVDAIEILVGLSDNLAQNQAKILQTLQGITVLIAGLSDVTDEQRQSISDLMTVDPESNEGN